jgi:hypothetical protein
MIEVLCLLTFQYELVHDIRPSIQSIELFLPSTVWHTLVVQSKKAEQGTSKQVQGIADQISGSSEKFIVPNVSHTWHKEAPVVTAEKVQQFI